MSAQALIQGNMLYLSIKCQQADYGILCLTILSFHDYISSYSILISFQPE